MGAEPSSGRGTQLTPSLRAVLVAGVFPDKIFTYAQTDCEDPAGTKLLYYSILAFLCLGVLVLGVFIVK